MIPIARRIGRVGRGRLAVFRLLNSVRGWDTRHTPVHDAHWALEQMTARLGTLPTCLVGHSLGGRAALLAADRAEVRSAVALAPWVHASEEIADIAGRQILFVHGSRDRIARPERSAALARRLARTTRVGYVCIRGGTHAMLRRHALFGSLAADFALATLLGAPVAGAVGRIRAGESWIEL
jgi:dienelactone hydrolase